MAGKMKGKTIADVSQETLLIQAMIMDIPDGTEISYDLIQSRTGVEMDGRGKAFLRTALKRLRREYSTIWGHGIKLADAEMTMPLLVHKLGKIDNAVKRADKTQKNLQERFFSSLSADEQRQVLYIGAVFGAIRVAAENGRLLYKQGGRMEQKTNITIPYDAP